MLIATGSDRGALRKLGHFAARRWRLTDGSERSEILIAGEGLDRGPGSVFATLLHEAAHALAFARGIRDTSQGGRYHNRRFMAVATELGLQVGALRPYGLAATTMPPATAARYSERWRSWPTPWCCGGQRSCLAAAPGTRSGRRSACATAPASSASPDPSSRGPSGLR